MLNTYRRNEQQTHAMIKTQEDFFNKIYLPLTLFERVRKGCVGFYCERELVTEKKLQYFDLHSYGRQRCVFLVLLMLNRSPGVHSAGCWLSLLHLISIFSGPQFIRAPSPFGLVWLSLPHLVSNSVRSSTQLARRTQLSYMIVRRPLDLWNRMFNRHQAEITVIQFRGHSLPVHHSVVAQWDLHLVPYYQP